MGRERRNVRNREYGKKMGANIEKKGEVGYEDIKAERQEEEE